MQKLIKASLLLVILSVIHTQAFAGVATCGFAGKPISDVKSIHLTEDSLVLNGTLEIPLEKTHVRCGMMGRRDRLDGSMKGFQVVQKDCTASTQFEGQLIDAVKQEVADISCND